MKTTIVIAAALAASTAEAFVAAPTARTTVTTMSAQHVSRRAFAGQAAVAVIGATAFSQAASAAKYFGDKNDYPEVVTPEAAVKDEAAYGSAETKLAVSTIRSYKTAVGDLKATLQKDNQADIRAALKKSLDLSKLREALNTAGSAFDEDSQRGLDRITRLILQDAVELDEASKLKAGTARNQRRIDLMTTKLEKLSGQFDEMLKFF